MINKAINPITRINMHLHTNVSDGALSPARLVQRAKQIGLDLISITDHDTADAYRLLPNDVAPLRIMPGIEISSQHEGHDVHILAMGFRLGDPVLLELTEMYLVGRRDRAILMLAKLNEMGFDISLDEVVAVAGSRELIVRPHIAQVMVAKGYCQNKNEAFDKYIGNDKPAHYHKPEVSVAEAIRVIHAAGGWAIAAHPGKLAGEDYLDQFIHIGLDGIEVWHPDHNQAQMEAFVAKAIKHGLFMTAGSDFHGEHDRHSVFNVVPAPQEVLDSVNKMWREYQCKEK